jgi:hypothetical protein
MTLREEFIKADILQSLAWVGMTHESKIKKLAKLYRDCEDKIIYAANKYDEATYGTVSIFVRSLITPEKGKAKLTYQQVLTEILHQKKIREKRAKLPVKIPRTGPFVKKSKRERQCIASNYRYSIWGTDYRGDKLIKSNECVGIANFSDTTLIVDSGGYSASPRIWMRDNFTRKIKLVVLEGGRVTSINNAILRLVPKGALRASLSGNPIKFDFNGECFFVEGKPLKWKKVKKIYYDEEVHQSLAYP